jgi:ABC-type spermidine/putrescine transport system permease subunit I
MNTLGTRSDLVTPKNRNKLWLVLLLLVPLAIINLTAFVVPMQRLIDISFREGQGGLQSLRNGYSFFVPEENIFYAQSVNE